MFVPNREDVRKAEWIRSTRQKKGLCVHQLAAKIDINPGRISEWENGKKPISVERFAQITKALNQ